MILTKKSKNAYRKPLRRVFVTKKVEQLPEIKEEELFNDDIMQIEEPKKKTKKKNNKE